tara:strand:- start:65 stop:469 length:405 start_codon:yes stop_codon:yes gene_type:complete
MINKSILEVFGEKSKDGDKVKGLLNTLMRNSYENGGQVEEDSGFFGNIMGMFKDFGIKRNIKKLNKEYNALNPQYDHAMKNYYHFIDNLENPDNPSKRVLEHEKLLYNQMYNTKGRMEQNREDYDALQKLLEGE